MNTFVKCVNTVIEAELKFIQPNVFVIHEQPPLVSSCFAKIHIFSPLHLGISIFYFSWCACVCFSSLLLSYFAFIICMFGLANLKTLTPSSWTPIMDRLYGLPLQMVHGRPYKHLYGLPQK